MLMPPPCLSARSPAEHRAQERRLEWNCNRRESCAHRVPEPVLVGEVPTHFCLLPLSPQLISSLHVAARAPLLRAKKENQQEKEEEEEGNGVIRNGRPAPCTLEAHWATEEGVGQTHGQ